MSALVALLLLHGQYPDSAVVAARAKTGSPLKASSVRAVARDGNGWVHVVYVHDRALMVRDSAIVFHTFSTDNGRTWSSPEKVSRSESTAVGPPSLAAGPDNRLHCVWPQSFWNGSRWVCDFVYSYQDALGWSEPVNISNMNQLTNAHDASCVAVAPGGRVHVAFAGNTFEYPDIYHTWSDGDSWSQPYRLSTTQYDDNYPSICCDRFGRVHLAWGLHQWRTRGDTIYYACYDTAWSAVEVAAAPGDGAAYPAIACDSAGRPVITYLAGYFDTSDVFFCRRDDQGNWQQTNLSNSRTWSAFPCITVDRADKYYAVWAEYAGRADVVMRVFDGWEWGPIQNLTQDTFTSTLPHLAFPTAPDRIDLCWASSLGGTRAEVVYMGLSRWQGGVTDLPVTEVHQVRFLPSASVVSGPFANLGYLTTRPGPVRLEIRDAAGRLVRHLVNAGQSTGRHSATWDRLDDFGRDVPCGVYFCTLRNASEGVSRKLILTR